MQPANCVKTSARTLEWRTSVNITGAKAGHEDQTAYEYCNSRVKARSRHSDPRSLPSQCSAFRHCTNKKGPLMQVPMFDHYFRAARSNGLRVL